MSGRPVVHVRRALVLAAVVTGLLIGLVGMHHLSVTPELSGNPPPSAAVAMSSHAADPDAPADKRHNDGGGHDSGLLHLCLAILTAFALVISAAVWSQPIAVLRGPLPGTSRVRSAPRAPPPTAPARLALLCVLRT